MIKGRFFDWFRLASAALIRLFYCFDSVEILTPLEALLDLLAFCLCRDGRFLLCIIQSTVLRYNQSRLSYLLHLLARPRN